MHNNGQDKHPGIVAVALNPAVDRTLLLADFALEQVNRVDRERINSGGTLQEHELAQLQSTICRLAERYRWCTPTHIFS